MHAVYSPDLAPSDYHLFASICHGLTEQRFNSHEETNKWLEGFAAYFFGAEFTNCLRDGINLSLAIAIILMIKFVTIFYL